MVRETTLDQPPGPNTWPPTTTPTFALNFAPSVITNVVNPTAPDVQKARPGYKAANIVPIEIIIAADLTAAGPACNAYGNDITDLALRMLPGCMPNSSSSRLGQ
jgi:alpha-glucosidase